MRQISVDIERRATGEIGKAERRIMADRREEATRLTCTICKEVVVGYDLMRNHLMRNHQISSIQATVFTKRMIEWKQEKLNPALFPPTDYRGIF